MKKLFVLLLFIFYGTICFAQAQNWLWVETATGKGGKGFELNGSDPILTDAAGNVYISGFFSGDSIKLSNITLHNLNALHSSDAFIAKYNASGTALWAHNIFSDSLTISRSLTMDNAGFLYLLGTFDGDSVTVGSNTLYSNNSGGSFIAKYSSSGSVQWAVLLAETRTGSAVAADSSGHLYVTGVFYDTVVIGSIPVTADSMGGYLARLDAGTGAVQWVKSYDGEEIFTSDIEVDKLDNPVITGVFKGDSISFGNTVIAGPNMGIYRADIFVAKYDSLGTLLWADVTGGVGAEEALALAIDASNNIFIGGSFDSSFTFGTTNLSADPGGIFPFDGFVLKYNASGIPQSAFQISGDGTDQIQDMFIDKQDHLYIAGVFTSSVLSLAPGDSLIKSPAYYEVFFAEYDNAGNVLRRAKPVGQNQISWITVDTSGNIYLAGGFYLNMDFGIVSFYAPPVNYYDLFLAKYGACGAALPQPPAIAGNDTVCNGTTQVYSISPVAGANLYYWSLPAGWSGSSTDTSITVTTGNTGGMISVAAASNCDTSQAQAIMVTVVTPPSASILEGGVVSICQGNVVNLTAATGTVYSYQWMFNNSLIPGATSNTYAASQPGSYQLIASNNGCSDTSSATLLTIMPAPAKPVVVQSGFVLSTTPNQGTYQWYKNNQVIPGANNDSFTVTQNGDYYVKVTNSYGCFAYSDTISILSIGISDLEENDMILFPQPAHEYLTIKTPFTLYNVQLQITTAQGAIAPYKVLSKENHLMRLKIGGVTPGVYFISIKADDKIFHQKIVLE